MFTPRPSGIPVKPTMLGASSLGKLVPSYLTKIISDFPVLLISRNGKLGNPTVRLIVPRSWLTLSKLPVIKKCFSPLKGREMTFASDKNFFKSSYPLRLYAITSPFMTCSIFVGKIFSLRTTLQSPESWISSLKKLRKEARVFDPNVCIEADEMTCTVNSDFYNFYSFSSFRSRTSCNSDWKSCSSICSLFALIREYDGRNNVGLSVISKILSVNDCS